MDGGWCNINRLDILIGKFLKQLQRASGTFCVDLQRGNSGLQGKQRPHDAHGSSEENAQSCQPGG